jgi:DNA-binding response OmpR family regulator
MTKVAKRILVVDDDPEMCASLRRVLYMIGNFVVETANDGLSALRMIADSKPDLVLLDIRMPGMDGYDVCRSIRETISDPIKILVVSGVLDTAEMERMMELGADDYLAKPFHNESLLMKLTRFFSN